MKLSSQQAARITAPTTGTVIALDPDIPPNRQRVSFHAEGTELRWVMDGKVFGKGATVQWLPWPGRSAGMYWMTCGWMCGGLGQRRCGTTNNEQAP